GGSSSAVVHPARVSMLTAVAAIVIRTVSRIAAPSRPWSKHHNEKPTVARGARHDQFGRAGTCGVPDAIVSVSPGSPAPRCPRRTPIRSGGVPRMVTLWRTVRRLLEVLPPGTRRFVVTFAVLQSMLAILDVAAIGLLALIMAPMLTAGT